MSTITIHLRAEIEHTLKEKAKESGQSLQAFLEQLAEHEACNGNGASAARPEADDEFAERPWRGIFVPPRPRKLLFSHELAVGADQLPQRPSPLNMSWHRMVTDDE